MGNPYAPPGENPRPQGPPTPDGRDADAGSGQRPSGPDAGGPDPDPPQGWPSPGTPPGVGPHGTGPQHGGPGHGGPGHGGLGPGGPHGHSSPQRPEPPAPDSEIARATSRRVLHFLAFLLASVLTTALPLPWQVAALGFLGGAIVVGIRALVLAWRGGIRGGLVVMLTAGVVMAGFVGLGMLSLLALWPQQVERQECLARAVTISSTRACQLEFDRAVDERLGGMGTPGGSS